MKQKAGRSPVATTPTSSSRREQAASSAEAAAGRSGSQPGQVQRQLAAEIAEGQPSLSPAEGYRGDEASQRASAEQFRALFESVPIGIGIADRMGNLLAFNHAVLEPGGYSREDIQKIGNLAALYYDPRQRDEVLAICANHGVVKNYPVQFKRRDGLPYDTLLSLSLTTFNGQPCVQAMVEDITERKRAEEEKAALEAQLQQAQKMESVGRLAGGVAHDFNNMLGVILGHAELALDQVDPDQPLRADLMEIQKAAQRSADLTRQLLTFARKQTIAPKVLDLNETIAAMLSMLERLIGENILLDWKPAPDLWPVRMDRSQLDQILANLCVNAKDAISGVGTVTVVTGNSILDESYCATHPGCVPGEYVRLTVSDTGCGMDSDTRARLFEPFFTTKAFGHGSGLGLASVYGAVTQNDGVIDVESALGQGTTVTIYLPRRAGKAEQARIEGAAGPLIRGHETILLVEDEPAILHLTKTMLEQLGYTVLAASAPCEAPRLAEQHAAVIHLLMTDVVMPEMNGRDLARNLLSLYPHLKRLFMSGYTAEVIARDGAVDDGAQFIQKPFSMPELATKVRHALDAEN